MQGDLFQKAQGRKAIYTSGLVSHVGGHRIALFLTGNRHAGENLADLLKRRQAALNAPIQMCGKPPATLLNLSPLSW